MRIVNEKHLALVWNWDETEKGGLERKYRSHLEQLLFAIQDRIDRNRQPAVQDLRDLANELQQAGETLQECMQNCYDAAATVYALAAPTPEERERRREFLRQIGEHVGKPVVLKQTSVAEVEGKPLTLEEIRGIKGILRDEAGLWEALVDFLVPVLNHSAPPKPGEPAGAPPPRT
ncbi:MAG: hypothetical protein BWZ02_01916 [Lentisphaerae bacterium ADurb.BinA184]|nr:MAG: hypothetical protein BWZ02_01916 [Lentisphaerae bacterium ADurb.BinA184]